jgi:hypothetical protein
MRSQDADGNNLLLSRIYGRQWICCFYDRSDYDVCSVVVWAEIPDVIENKVYSQVTTDKEHKKLMKVHTQKTTNKTNKRKTIIATLTTMLSSWDHRDTPNLRKRTRPLMPGQGKHRMHTTTCILIIWREI